MFGTKSIWEINMVVNTLFSFFVSFKKKSHNSYSCNLVVPNQNGIWPKVDLMFGYVGQDVFQVVKCPSEFVLRFF